MMATFETLKRRTDFLRAARGRKAVRPTLVLQCTPRSRSTSRSDDGASSAIPRVGFTATRKLGGAVTRNRVKRRLREAVRAIPDDCIRPDRDYVLIGRGRTCSASFATIVDDLRTALRAVANPAKTPKLEKVGQT